VTMARKLHPEVWVDLNGTEDRMVIVGRVTNAMRVRAVPDSRIQEFREQTYKMKNLDDLLALCRRWVEVTRD